MKTLNKQTKLTTSSSRQLTLCDLRPVSVCIPGGVNRGVWCSWWSQRFITSRNHLLQPVVVMTRRLQPFCSMVRAVQSTPPSCKSWHRGNFVPPAVVHKNTGDLFFSLAQAPSLKSRCSQVDIADSWISLVIIKSEKSAAFLIALIIFSFATPDVA